MRRLLYKDLERELAAVERAQRQWLSQPFRPGPLNRVFSEKVPPGLQKTLETAFYQAFRLIFLKGSRWIEKTFNQDALATGHQNIDDLVNAIPSRRSLQQLDRTAQKSSRRNSAITTASGLGMGFAGVGLPDIPLFVAILLKGVYEIALSYGFDYHTRAEQIYILRLIRAALSHGRERSHYFRELDAPLPADVDPELLLTAQALSRALLVEKFVQGLPFVGVTGGVVNYRAYQQVSSLALLCYKKRYLQQKLAEKP